MPVNDTDDGGRSGGTPISPPAVAGFPGLLGLLLISPTAGNGKGSNASTLVDKAEWRSYDYYIDLDTVLKGIFGALLLWRLAIEFVRYLRTIACMEAQQQLYFRKPNFIWALIKRHLLYAPVFGDRYSKELQIRRRVTRGGKVSKRPTRFQALVMLCYIGVNIAFCVVDINWSADRITVLDEFRNRTGILAMENMVLMFLFIMRSNPVAYILNISFDSNQFMHAWFAHIFVAQAACHVVAWTIGQLELGGFRRLNKSMKLQYINTAVLGTVALSIVWASSFAPIRHAFYRIFAHLHILFTFTMLLGLYLHLNHIPHKVLVIATILLWSLERGLRLLSILWRNVGKGGTHALIELTADDTMRLTLTVARPWKFKAGSHIQLYIPSVSWKSHPFAVAWQPETYSLPSESRNQDAAASKNKSYVLLIRARKGFTNTLFEKVLKAENNMLFTRAFVEGPYDERKSFDSYGTVLLIAGGIGITAQTSRATNLIERVGRGLAVARTISLIWYIQRSDHIQWIAQWLERIDKAKVPGLFLKIQIFVTRENRVGKIGRLSSLEVLHKLVNPGGPVIEGSFIETRTTFEVQVTSMVSEEKLDSIIARVFYRKPSIEDIVDIEIEEQIGAMIVSVCGPASMSNESRRVVRRRQTVSNIDFLEESFYS